MTSPATATPTPRKRKPEPSLSVDHDSTSPPHSSRTNKRTCRRTDGTANTNTLPSPSRAPTPTPYKRKQNPSYSMEASSHYSSSQSKRTCRRTDPPPSTPSSMVLVNCKYQSYDDLVYADTYKQWSRAKLTERTAIFHHQKNQLEQQIADRRAVKRNLDSQNVAEEKKITQVQNYLSSLVEGNQGTKYRMKQNAGDLARMQPELIDVDAHLGTLEYMLRFDVNKPYACNPMSFVEDDLAIHSPSDTARLGYDESVGVLCQQKNLGLELHPEFPGDTLRTGKGNDNIFKLHDRINFNMGFPTTSSEDSDEAVAREIERDLRDFEANYE